MKQCVITLATEDGDFKAGIERLEKSLQKSGYRGDFLSWKGTYPPGSPSHLEAPFAFKPFCFMEAKKKGYDSILWADSSCVVIKNIEPIFTVIEQEGYIVFKNASLVLGEWCSDEALESFAITRDEALRMPEAKGGAVGLNMHSEVAGKFLERWYEKATDGSTFRGVREALKNSEDYNSVKCNKNSRVSKDPRVRGHRHDQSALGIIAYQLGMKLSDEHIVTSVNPYNSKTIIFVDRDVKVNARAFNRRYLFYIFCIKPWKDYIKKKSNCILGMSVRLFTRRM